MKTLSDVIKDYRIKSFDCRDFNRLLDYIPEDKVKEMTLNDPLSGDKIIENDLINYPGKIIDFTKENIINSLKNDLSFAYEKACDQRGLSADAMYNVIKMWVWILELDVKNIPYGYSEGYYEGYGKRYFEVVAEAIDYELEYID
jgi:hypothetical protein